MNELTSAILILIQKCLAIYNALIYATSKIMPIPECFFTQQILDCLQICSYEASTFLPHPHRAYAKQILALGKDGC